MNQMEKRYRSMFVPNALRVPDVLPIPTFRAPSTFQGPPELILTGYCTPVENQGAKPWCAAYAATSYAESIRWRIDGHHRDIDPEPVYRYAKTIDGMPGDGTYLECALEAILALGHLPDTCRVRTFRSLRDLKYAIHRQGACLAGFDISEEWFSPRKGVVRGGCGGGQGGHAVVACGYDEGGVIILNSWGADWGHDGFVYLTDKAFGEQFIYGAALTGVFDNME